MERRICLPGDDYRDTFDVIMTDSSDPQDPPESFFKKSYFQLLYGTLKEGSVIITRACTLCIVFLAKFVRFDQLNIACSLTS